MKENQNLQKSADQDLQENWQRKSRSLLRKKSQQILERKSESEGLKSATQTLKKNPKNQQQQRT